jgi:hypothetical protein
MASPIGTVPAYAGIGYDSLAVPNTGLFYPYVPVALGSATVYTGSTNTASSESGASSTFSNKTTMSFYVNPFQVDRDMAFKEVRMAVSGNTVAATGSGTAAWMAGLYKVSTTSNETTSNTCYTLAHGPWQFNILASQNSVTAQTYKFWSGTHSSLSSGANSTAGNISTDMTIQAAISMYSSSVPTTITEGHYLMVHGFSSRSSSNAVFSCNHGFYLSNSNTANNTRFLGGVVFTRPHPLVGNFSATTEASNTSAAADVATHYNPMPNSFASSGISCSAAGAIRWLVPDFI